MMMCVLVDRMRITSILRTSARRCLIIFAVLGSSTERCPPLGVTFAVVGAFTYYASAGRCIA